jgi:HAD superfamily hydrolase (TIGR01549 family)
MVRWVFLDVGNILLDEDPLTYHNFRRHVEAIQRVRPDRTFHDLLAEFEARAGAGDRWPLATVVARYLDEAACVVAWQAPNREIRASYASFSPPVVGAARVIEQLGNDFHLGLIANQGAECRAHLAALGWLDRFEVVAFSEEQGAYKPDPQLFRHALRLAGMAPEESLMVGDRLDNDIVPAASLGMATAWVRWPRRAAKGWPTVADSEALTYLASLERTAATASIEPDITIETIAELDAALRSRPGLIGTANV